MKSNEVLARARQLLTIYRQISGDHVKHRNETSVKFGETRHSVSRHQLGIAQNRLAVLATRSRIRRFLPAKPASSMEGITGRERQTLARIHAKENIRAAVGRRFREQAKQAAIDRANLIVETQSSLPPDMWEAVIEDYDRRLYESREEDAS